jgi:hypothetical protein
VRRRCIELGLFGILLAGTPAAAPAQAQLVYFPLDSGTVVRLHPLRAGGATISGALLEPFAPESTRFVYCAARPGPCRWNLAQHRRITLAADVRRVDVRRGSRSTQGALIGMAVLVGGSAAFCALTDTGGCDPADGGFISYVALPSALLGAAIGAVIGGGVPKWQPAP